MDGYALVINNESEAWDTLLEAVAGKLPSGLTEINLDNWPVFEIKLQGAKFQSSLTPKIMEAFIHLQRDIYRAFANIHYGSPTANVLTDEDKRALEIIVQVSPGSSDLKAILKGAVDTLSRGIANKMEAKHWVIVALGAGLFWTANSTWSNYLQHQKDVKQIEAQIFAEEKDVRRMEILAEAVKIRPELQIVQDDAAEFYNSLLKGSARADTVEIAGHQISQGTVKQLTRSTRSRSHEVQLNGLCRILKVDSSKPEAFFVEVKHEDGRTFTAKLEEALLATKEKNKQLLQAAEWGKTPVYLVINGKELRGEITQATILDVRETP